MASVIQNPTSSQPIGSFNNIAYVRHKGKFVGSTVSGKFVVPYEITTPANPVEGNRTFVLEPPHYTEGPITRKVYLGKFFWKRGFSHASVGYSNVWSRTLDRNPGYPIEIYGNPITVLPLPAPPPDDPRVITDDNILRQLALTLRQTPPPFLGKVERIYGIGLSDSGTTMHRVYALFGHKLLDISFPCNTDYVPPIKGATRVMVFNTEADFNVMTNPDPAFTNYRWYAVAGAPHIPDTGCTRDFFKDDAAPPAFSVVAGTTPIDWVPFIKALFVAGDEWVRTGKQPPASVLLKVNPGNVLARDVVGNALGGIRHPALGLKEAKFIASIVRGRGWELFGAYGNPRPGYPAYLDQFKNGTLQLVKDRFLLTDDQNVLNQRAALQRPGFSSGTYTVNYARGWFQTPAPTDECDP